MGGGGERGQRIGERTLTHDSEGRHIAEEANDKHRQQYQNSGEAPIFHGWRSHVLIRSVRPSSIITQAKPTTSVSAQTPKQNIMPKPFQPSKSSTAVAIIRTWSSRSCRRAP